MESRSAALLVILSLVCLPLPAAEKALPPQEQLDACFGDSFSLEEQLPLSYTALELAALDRALGAMGMTRRDLEFRKDYGEAHLAFPLVLDMMKHPLHIAPYMDGLVSSLEAPHTGPGPADAEVAAAAALHPGIGQLPSPLRDDPPARSKTRDDSDVPWNARRFHVERMGMFLATHNVRRALVGLQPTERDALRLSLPQLLTWHDVFASPWGKERTKELQELIEAQESEAWLDELATRIDLRVMAAAWLALPDPWALVEQLGPEDFPREEPYVIDMPWGRMAIGTPGNDTYRGEFALLVDPGGDDTYEDCRLGAAYGADGRAVGFFLDMEGDDRYFCRDTNVTLGASVLGVAAFYDLGGGDDLYQGGHLALGAAAGGIATFLDDGGSDHYSMKVFGQGAAGYGVGVMLDRAPDEPTEEGSPANTADEEVDQTTLQNDRYEAWLMAQGFARQWGVGLCHGSRGNDVYHAGGVYLHAPLFNDRYQSFSQGFSIGSRGIDYAGGLAVLVDDGGNDTYLGDIYNQGVGYWYAAGLLIDRGGNDHYEMTQYGQGAGIHLAVGGVLDESGNDSYLMSSGLGQGGSHDFAASVMMDRGGVDRYLGSTTCNGAGLTNAVGLFFEREGDDIYGANPNVFSLGGGRWGRDTGSVGVFVDTGGLDHYLGKGQDGGLWTQSKFGAGLDMDPPEIEERPAPQGQADKPQYESVIDIPEICSYEGELTDEVFEELWEIAIRWGVGDNRVIVPRARERLVAFGAPVLPKIDGKFDDSYGLTLRALKAILQPLHQEHPQQIEALLTRNLLQDERDRRLNALRLIGHLKLTQLGGSVVPALENEKLRGTAVATLGEIESTAGNDELLALLRPDTDQRLILGAASTLVKLDADGLYPLLRPLLEHEFFTVREGLVALMARHQERFLDDVLSDLESEETGRRLRLALLRMLALAGELEPSQRLYLAVRASLGSDDWSERAFAARALSHWLSYEDEGWKPLQERIETRLERARQNESDPHVRFVLDAT